MFLFRESLYIDRLKEIWEMSMFDWFWWMKKIVLLFTTYTDSKCKQLKEIGEKYISYHLLKNITMYFAWDSFKIANHGVQTSLMSYLVVFLSYFLACI